MDEILALFEKARKQGYMDTEDRKKIFRFFSHFCSCFPLKGTKVLKADGNNPEDAKIPKISGWTKGCTDRIEMNDYETDMIGICCGPHNGILLLDVDDEDKFSQYCVENGLEVPRTLKVKTGDGYHLLYKYPQDDKNYRCRSLKNFGFDIRGNGGYMVAPGSSHPNGCYYDIIDDNDGVFSDPPQWLLDLASESALSTQEGAVDIAQVHPVLPDPSLALMNLEASYL